VQADYNFETPATNLLTGATTVVKLPANDKYEMYDYPGGYGKKADGDAATKLRMEGEETSFDVVSGAGTCTSFTPGGKFTLKSHDSPSERGKCYVVTKISHSAEDRSYTAGAGSGLCYSNTFACIPDAVTFRPARNTPRPIVQGPQTAVVVGKEGEEVNVDKYGRVKVQFYWDRQGKKDENSSCWVRVAEGWAGKSWGTMFLPRIGQEVVVDFLDGDPDRPIVTGRAYNAERMPPYELPKNQTRSTIKSRSCKDGGAAHFNELRFEDRKGSEQVFLHAERDMDRRVKNDSREFVGGAGHLVVKGTGLSRWRRTCTSPSKASGGRRLTRTCPSKLAASGRKRSAAPMRWRRVRKSI
jgi:type VI secretion system secreted protein VgrG